MIGFDFDGDVSKLKTFLNKNVWKGNMEREIKKATLRNALYLVREVRKAINQRKYGENAPLTLAFKKTNMPLMDQRNLWRAIDSRLISSYKAEVGIIIDGVSTGGKFGKSQRQIALSKLVTLMESGYTITVTDKMKKAIAIALQKKAENAKDKGEKDSADENVRRLGMIHGGKTYVVPPRKLFTAVWDDPNTTKIIQLNWKMALEAAFLSQGAQNGEHKMRDHKLVRGAKKYGKKAEKATKGAKKFGKATGKKLKKAGKATSKSLRRSYKSAKKGMKKAKKFVVKKFK